MMPYLRRLAVYAMLAAILTLLPTAMWADIVTPLPAWGSQYTAAHPPPFVRRELVLFRVFVLPVAVTANALGLSPTTYGFIAMVSAGIQTSDAGPLSPPGLQTAQFVRLAFPFWFVALSLTVEAIRAIARRRLHGRVG